MSEEESRTTKAPMTVDDIQFAAWAALDRMAEIHLGDRLAVQKGLGLIQTTEFLKREAQDALEAERARVAAREAMLTTALVASRQWMEPVLAGFGLDPETHVVWSLVNAALQRLQEGK